MRHHPLLEIALRRVAGHVNPTSSTMLSKRQARETVPSPENYHVESSDIRKQDVVTDGGRENMLAVTQRAMERRIHGLSFHDPIDKQTFRQMSGMKSIVVAKRENKIRRAGGGPPC